MKTIKLRHDAACLHPVFGLDVKPGGDCTFMVNTLGRQTKKTSRENGKWEKGF